MLKLRNLSKIYQTKTRRVAALDGVSFALPEKGFVFILGRSGSGKTTMLNMLGGLDAPTEGELIVDGVSSRDFKQIDFDHYRNRYVGFVFQEYHLLDDYTVADNIALALELQGDLTPEERQQKIEAALAQVDLAGYGDRNTGELSGGQKQRVAIARALVKDPSMILADEPTGALDRKTGRQLFDLLKEISKNKLVVVVSHDEDFAHEYADRILELEEGKIVSDSAPVAKAEATQAKAEKLPRLGLSLKSVLNRGKITLRRKRWQISVISLLCVISFVLMGVSDMLTSYDWKTTMVNSLLKDSPHYVAVKKQQYNHYQMDEISPLLPTEEAVEWFRESGFRVKNARPGWYDGYALREEDMQRMAERTGAVIKGVYKPLEGSTYINLDILKNYKQPSYRANVNTKPALTVETLSGFMELTESDLAAFDFKLQAGRLPDGTKNEVAVSKYVYESFLLNQHLSYTGPTIQINQELFAWDEFLENGLEILRQAKDTPFDGLTIATIRVNDAVAGEEYPIATEADLLGKTLFIGGENYTVVGIVDTGFDGARYADLTKFDLDSGGEDAATRLLVQELQQERTCGMACLAFVGEGRVEEMAADDVTWATNPDMTFSFVYKTMTGASRTANADTLILLESLPRELLSQDVQNGTDQAEFFGLYRYLYQLAEGDLLAGAAVTDISLQWEDGHISISREEGTLKRLGLPDAFSLNETYQRLVPTFGDGFILRQYAFDLLTEGRAGTYAYAVIATPDERAAVSKLVDDCYLVEDYLRYPMQGIVASQLNKLNDTLTSIAALFSRVDVLLIGFTALLFTAYIFISIAQQKQAIGIMRALGAGTRDVFSIYFMESILISVIGCVTSIGLLLVLTPAANLLLQDYLSIKLTILTLSLRQVLAIVLLSFGVAVVASIIPILRIARQKPVDAIRKN